MILCPRCERPLEGHDDGHCHRRMSRRHFLFSGAAAAALIVVPPLPDGFVKDENGLYLLNLVDNRGFMTEGYAGRYRFNGVVHEVCLSTEDLLRFNEHGKAPLGIIYPSQAGQPKRLRI